MVEVLKNHEMLQEVQFKYIFFQTERKTFHLVQEQIFVKTLGRVITWKWYHGSIHFDSIVECYTLISLSYTLTYFRTQMQCGCIRNMEFTLNIVVQDHIWNTISTVHATKAYSQNTTDNSDLKSTPKVLLDERVRSFCRITFTHLGYGSS